MAYGVSSVKLHYKTETVESLKDLHHESVNLAFQELRPSIHQIIDWVQQCRNSKIKSFMQKDVVIDFFRENMQAQLSERKYEFLSRDLKELMLSQVDLVHYSSVITELKESPDKPEPVEHCNSLVMDELSTIFRKYIF
ncbi:MAG TPA: hypothetical protein VIN08_10990 [Ohtaekwangia sp.]|uniref:hypothetical protein n=1 Tax=Ohtaekwangia sp. TaxID=2066019 RepID=UPI002F931255